MAALPEEPRLSTDQLSRRHAWIVALAATLTMTVSYVDRSTLAVLAPTVTKALDISDSAYGWLTSSFSIAYLVSTPLAGWWIDRAGARRGLLVSVLAWSAVAGLHALVPGFGMLLALRIGLGVTEGPSFPGTAQTVQRALPPADRPRGFGVLFTGSSIGSMVAPLLASFLYDHFGWREAFLGTALIGLSWVPMWLLLTSPAKVAAQLDVPAVTLAEPPEPPPENPPFRELHAKDAERPPPRPRFRDLLTHPTLLRAVIAILATAPVLGFIGSWGAKFLVKRFDLHQEDVGHYLWVPPVCLDVGAILFGDLNGRLRRAAGSPPRLLFAVAAAMTASLALLPLAATPWQAMALFGLTQAGGGALYALVTADALGRLPPAVVSSAGGVIVGGQSLALIISSPLIGYAVDAHVTHATIAVVLAAWIVPGALAWLLWRPRS
jgi:ACS family hexuronate transporter-like MFS transporter